MGGERTGGGRGEERGGMGGLGWGAFEEGAAFFFHSGGRVGEGENGKGGESGGRGGSDQGGREEGVGVWC